MTAVGACAAQPKIAAVRPPSLCHGCQFRRRLVDTVCDPGCRATDLSYLRDGEFDASCAVSSVLKMEVMTPIFTRKAWQATHSKLLLESQPYLLKKSAWNLGAGALPSHSYTLRQHSGPSRFLGAMWCGMLAEQFPHSPPCVVTWHKMLHLNWNSIDKFVGNDTQEIVRGNMLPADSPLHMRYVVQYKNHLVKKCWSLGALNGVSASGNGASEWVSDIGSEEPGEGDGRRGGDGGGGGDGEVPSAASENGGRQSALSSLRQAAAALRRGGWDAQDPVQAGAELANQVYTLKESQASTIQPAQFLRHTVCYLTAPPASRLRSCTPASSR